MSKLTQDYYQHPDVLHVSRNLLGKYLMTHIEGQLTGGKIIETEAYCGPEDRASHAYQNRRTPRNDVMYHEGGIAYVYQCYGIHALFNIVTHTLNVPHAVLIRAIEPSIGIETMLKRRNKKMLDRTLCGGPGSLSKALGITKAHNGLPLTQNTIWIEEREAVPSSQIHASPRVGIDYAGKDAKLPWRYRIGNVRK